MDSDKDKTYWGIWIPREGWLKGKDIFADTSLVKARQVARLIGRDARVYFIDTSIIDFERQYLEQERRNIWQKIKTMISRLLSSSSKKTIHT